MNFRAKIKFAKNRIVPIVRKIIRTLIQKFRAKISLNFRARTTNAWNLNPTIYLAKPHGINHDNQSVRVFIMRNACNLVR